MQMHVGSVGWDWGLWLIGLYRIYYGWNLVFLYIILDSNKIGSSGINFLTKINLPRLQTLSLCTSIIKNRKLLPEHPRMQKFSEGEVAPSEIIKYK